MLNNENSIRKICYFFALFPLIFNITILTFYIHGHIISGYWNISAINPSDMYLYNFYALITIVSFLATFFTFFIWFLILSIYLFKTKNKLIYKPIKVTTILYLLAIILFFSNVFKFSID